MALDSLRDGFVRICFDTSGNVAGKKCRLVLDGQYFDPGLGCTVTPNQLVRVTDVREIDCQFGAGSVLSESLKTAISCCNNRGIDIYALPREDALLSVKARYTMTFTGPAVTDGRADIYWGDGRYNISVRVFSGDTAAIIAGNVAAAIPDNFPYTASVTGAVITLTAKNGGTVGNWLKVKYNWHGRNNYAPVGVDVTTVQTVIGTGDPIPTDYAATFGECCVCCLAVLSGNQLWQDAAIAYLDEAWSCDTPQCFGQAYTYNAGSLGQILADDTNSATMVRLAHCTGDDILPWLKTANQAATSCCQTVDNPELSIEGPEFGVLSCVTSPQSCASCFTFDERQQLKDAGFVVTTPLVAGSGAMTSPMINNDVTNNRYDSEGNLNLTFQSASSRRLAAKTADEIAKQLKQFQGLGYYTDGTVIKEGVKGTNKRAIEGFMRAWAKSQIGILFSEFEDINTDISFTDDFETAPKCQGVPGNLRMVFNYRPPVRLGQVAVSLAPKVLSNC
jgi:hypothetical protein